MYRFLFPLLGGLMFISTAVAQTGSVTARLIDSLSREPLAGAVVHVIPLADTTKKQYVVSNAQGNFSVSGLAYGNYKLRVSYIGFSNLERRISVRRTQTNLGTLYMRQTMQRIGTVTVEGVALRTSQRGDTLSYNASAFKVTKDSDAEGLISKMPGITVIDGEVEAQGETVKKVFVDGREFFGEDVTSALRNLPAEIIQKVEVYNKLSDNAEFTGVDDGEGFKAINIVTNPGMRQGQFGKLYAGYGFDDKYLLGGSVNVFTAKHRISFIGLLNNLNQQNFSTEDILGVTGSSNSGRGGMRSRGGGRMRSGGGRGGGGTDNFMVPQQAGVSTVGSFGVNYSAQWSKKFDIQASYFFNTNKNENDRVTDRSYFSTTDTLRNDLVKRASESRNYNNRFNARMEWKISDRQSLMIRPSVSLQSYSSNSQESTLSEYSLGAEPLIRTFAEQFSDSKSSGYNISNSVVYRIRLGQKAGRMLMVSGNVNLNKNDRTQTQRNNDYKDYEYYDVMAPDSVYGRFVDSRTSGYRLSGRVMYTEPLTAKSQLNMQYNVSYNNSDAKRKTFLYEYDEVNDSYYLNPEFDENLSSIHNSGYLTHRAGPGYRFNDPKNMVSASVSFQRATLTSDREFPVRSYGSLTKTFDDVVYFGMWNHTFTPNNTLRVFLRSSTDNPSISDLQDVMDVSSARSVSLGNPKLDPSYSHSARVHFVRSNTLKGRTFMLMGGFEYKNNSIVDSTRTVGRDGDVINGVEVDPFARVTKPINMDGDWNARTMVNFGFPLKPLKSNLNLYAGVTYNESPGMIDGLENISKVQYYNGGAVLGSNISENIDFTLSYNGGYNIARNTIESSSDNEFFSHSAGGKFKWVMWGGFTLSGSASYMQYKGITDDYNEEYLICNLYLGKKLFKNQRGEITFGVNDLLDQNKSFNRNVTAQYIENVTNRVIGRYWGFQFTYNLRNFRTKSAKQKGVGAESRASSSESSSRTQGMPGGYGGPGMGPGPGGPPPGGGPGGF